MRKYRNLLPLLIHTEDGSYKQGEVFEKDFTPADELENVDSGLIGIVPSMYKVVGESRVYDTGQGELFEAALLMENEAALIQGGHIERVEPEPEKKAAPKRKKGVKK
jgi:hypothetical protein